MIFSFTKIMIQVIMIFCGFKKLGDVIVFRIKLILLVALISPSLFAHDEYDTLQLENVISDLEDRVEALEIEVYYLKNNTKQVKDIGNNVFTILKETPSLMLDEVTDLIKPKTANEFHAVTMAYRVYRRS